ncbi:efflux RND transporter periplasmic adaptor subunit [Vibrio sp.]|uniref:efflux RND transporter periplasmic adaptor subunit n=1 Tax=Vibrio sp. TaxID=678 RepID=UPI003D0EC5FE
MFRFSPFGALSQRPWIVSLLLVIILSLWLGLGALKAEESAPPNAKQPVPLAKVSYQTFIAQPTDRVITLYGRTSPDKQAQLGAEIAGKIITLRVEKGQAVQQGDVIAEIDQADLAIQLERAVAMRKVKEKEFNAAQSLKSRGLQGEVAFANAQAALVEARASVATARQAISNTQVKAPFDGIVDHLFIERGDFVGVGDPVAKLIDLKKIAIDADVSERHIQELRLGQSAQVRFLDGASETGRLRYISRVSSPATNTFPIEVEVANPEQRIPAGISTEVALNLQQQLAVKITPSMLALDDVGNLGVKTLQKDRVHFVPIQLVKAEQDGVWLTGLGEKVDIITVGQGFVRDGDQVIAINQTAAQTE